MCSDNARSWLLDGALAGYATVTLVVLAMRASACPFTLGHLALSLAQAAVWPWYLVFQLP